MRRRGRARLEAELRAEAYETLIQTSDRVEAALKAQLDFHEHAQSSLLEGVQLLREEVVGQQRDVVRVLELVVNMCDRVIECVEADRDERRLFVETLGRIADSIATRPLPAAAAAPGIPPAERVIGGTVYADAPAASMPEPEHAPVTTPSIDELIDLTEVPVADGRRAPESSDLGMDLAEADEPRRQERNVEVLCRFGDRWVDGFEVCEVARTSSGLRYRLRRRSDGMVLPELFDAAQIRHVETFAELTPAQSAHARSPWFKL